MIELTTAAYDPALMGRPWIARVDFTAPMKEQYTFGEFRAQEKGGPGTLSIEAKPGDVIASGQKDLASGRGQTRFYLVDDDGDLKPQEDRRAAFMVWRGQNPQAQLGAARRPTSHLGSSRGASRPAAAPVATAPPPAAENPHHATLLYQTGKLLGRVVSEITSGEGLSAEAYQALKRLKAEIDQALK